jgi:hypothetical protein
MWPISVKNLVPKSPCREGECEERRVPCWRGTGRCSAWFPLRAGHMPFLGVTLRGSSWPKSGACPRYEVSCSSEEGPREAGWCLGWLGPASFITRASLTLVPRAPCVSPHSEKSPRVRDLGLGWQLQGQGSSSFHLAALLKLIEEGKNDIALPLRGPPGDPQQCCLSFFWHQGLNSELHAS